MHNCYRHMYAGGVKMGCVPKCGGGHIVHRGMGMGSQLLGGGGSASAYISPFDYERTTGKHPYVAGMGLGKRLLPKLENLEEKIKKARGQTKGPIHFSV